MNEAPRVLPEAASPLALGLQTVPAPDGATMDADDGAEAMRRPWPDLVIIDGGRGQLTAAQETLGALGITDMPLVAVAKGPDRDAGLETFFVPGRDPFKLKPRDPVLYFVQRLRDEAHRFAIGSHRVRRRRDIREAGLQEIPGIGPTRKRALLQHFGRSRRSSAPRSPISPKFRDQRGDGAQDLRFLPRARRMSRHDRDRSGRKSRMASYLCMEWVLYVPVMQARQT